MAARWNVSGRDFGKKSGGTCHRHIVKRFWKEEEIIAVGNFPSLLKTPGMEETEMKMMIWFSKYCDSDSFISCTVWCNLNLICIIYVHLASLDWSSYKCICFAFYFYDGWNRTRNIFNTRTDLLVRLDKYFGTCLNHLGKYRPRVRLQVQPLFEIVCDMVCI